MPYWSLLLLLTPALCLPAICDCIVLCTSIGIIAAAALFVTLSVVRELRLLGVRLNPYRPINHISIPRDPIS